MAEALKGVYRPRNPQATPFYHLVEDHGERLKNVYPDRYEHQFGYYRPIAEEVFFRYLDCGILRYGFARIHVITVTMNTSSHSPARHALSAPPVIFRFAQST